MSAAPASTERAPTWIARFLPAGELGPRELRRAKILIGLGKGKNVRDKREDVKQRDWQRQKARLMKENG